MNTDLEPTPIEETDASKRNIILGMTGLVIFGLCALFMLAFFWFQPSENTLFARYFPSPIATRAPTSTPAPTKTPAPNLTATQIAWIKPDQSPSLIAYDSIGSYLSLEEMADIRPELPDINQPGDVYPYLIQLEGSESLLWRYGWCTTTQEILNENFAHIQIEFTINTVVVDDFTVTDSQDGGSACREHIALLYRWPNGQHQIETRITFTEAIDDGWNVYPAGTHIFKYIVTVNQGFASTFSEEDAKTIQTTVANTASEWDTLLSDTFENNANRWYEGTSNDADGTIIYDVTDGKYRWSVTTQNELITRILLDEQVSDFYITADIQKIEKTRGDFGVIFREDDEGNFYYLAVSTVSSRQCSLLQFYDNEVTDLISWDTCPSLVPNGLNKVTIMAEGDHITALINDQLVGDVHSDLINGNGVGLAIRIYDGNDTGTYEFDNIELRVP